MKYKVGDKVKIREDLDVDKIYGNWDCSADMARCRGMIATIVECYGNYYCIDVDDKCYNWTDEMFEEKHEHISKFNVGDKVRLRKDLEVGTRYNGIILREEMYQQHHHNIMTIKYSDNDQYTCKENGYWWGEDMLEDVVESEDYAEPKSVDVGYYLEHCGHRVIKNVYYHYDDSHDHMLCATAGCINQYILPIKAIEFIIPHEVD